MDRWWFLSRFFRKILLIPSHACVSGLCFLIPKTGMEGIRKDCGSEYFSFLLRRVKINTSLRRKKKEKIESFRVNFCWFFFFFFFKKKLIPSVNVLV
jgi:hypothetical protein